MMVQVDVLKLVTAFALIEVVRGQTTCNFVTSKNLTFIQSLPPPSVYINNFSANKCIRIANFGHYPSKVFLDQCFWSTRTMTKDTKLYFRRNPAVTEGVTIFNDAGLGQEYCLALGGDGTLETNNCDPSSWNQTWRLKAVRGQDTSFLVQHAASSLCIVPKSSATKAPLTLNACNSYQTEQLWKLCVTY